MEMAQQIILIKGKEGRKMEYSQAAVEVLDMLYHTRDEDVAKIPHSFIRFLQDIADPHYEVYLDHTIPINHMNLQEKTKELLGFIYITWWSNDQERTSFKKKMLTYQKRFSGGGNTKPMQATTQSFTVETESKQQNSQTQMTEYREETPLQKLIHKIQTLWQTKKQRV